MEGVKEREYEGCVAALFQCFHVLILRSLCASSRVVRALPCMGRLHEENVFVSFRPFNFF